MSRSTLLCLSLLLALVLPAPLTLQSGGVAAGRAAGAAPAATQTVIDLTAVADTTVKSASPNTNFGGASPLQLAYGGVIDPYETRILISEATFEKAKDQVIARRLGAVRVKGKRKPVRIYELRGLGQPAGGEEPTVRAFEAAVDDFSERRWDEAEAGFRRVLETWASDPPSLHYLEEIRELRLHPPPPQWDGVYTATTK